MNDDPWHADSQGVARAQSHKPLSVTLFYPEYEVEINRAFLLLVCDRSFSWGLMMDPQGSQTAYE